MLKLQIGSNVWKKAGWINIDIDPSVNPDLVLDVRQGLPYQDNSIDYIFMEHFFEHINQQESQKLLHECYRALKSGGVIRISGPDLQKLAKLYLSGNFELWKSRSGAPGETICDFMNDVFYNWEHRYIPDPDQLTYMLRKANFKRISRCEFRISDFEELKNLEIREQSQNEDSVVEGIK